MFISIYNLALFGMLICSHVSADSPQQYQTAQPQMQTYEGHLPTDHNNTMLEIIEKLLQSRREGRNLDDQFNQVYADGHIDQALMQGNDVEARNLIRDKLCGLGLMSCDYEEKRPFYSTIYAQEMPPPPNYHGGPPQRPPPNYHHGPPPPHRIGYGEAPFKGNGRPPTGPGGSYGGPYLEHPPTGAGFGEHGGPTFDKPPPGAVIYGSKPPGPIFSGNGPNVDSHQSPPYAFESFNPVDKIKIGGSSGGLSFYAQQQQQQQITDTFPAPTNVVVGGSSGSNKADLQQHVHHHYHHLEGAAAANAKVPTVAIPVGGIQSINTDFSTLAQSSAAFNIDQSSSAFAAGFNNAGHGSLLSQQSGSIGDFGGPVHKPNGELYKPPYSLNSLPTPTNELYQPSGSSGIGSFGQGGFAPSSGSYHSQNPDYFKKELHNYGSVPSGNFNSLSTGYGASQYGETARQQFVDCKCVPFNQCPAADRIGRKEDLILPIDPRNLPKDIEALSEVPANATNDATTVSDNTQEKKETNDEGETKRSKRDVANATDKQSNDEDVDIPVDAEGRAYYGNRPQSQLQYQTCSVNEVCCRRPLRPQAPPVPPQAQFGRCGVRNAAGITGRIKNPSYVDGDAEFGEYPWHVAILKKDPNESIYACGGTLIDAEHVITAAHCIKSQNGFDLRARLGEWDVNHDVEFFPYIERDVVSVQVHPEYYAGTLDNDLAVLKLDSPVDFTKNPHISPACLPDKFSDWTGARCWTTGWGKDAFGEHGKYQNILKEVDVPILSHHQCETQLRQTRLGYSYKLNPGFICAGGEEGKDACKGDGGGPLVCERNGVWNAVGIVSWGIGCGQVNVPGVYVRVAHYLDWIQQVTRYYKK